MCWTPAIYGAYILHNTPNKHIRNKANTIHRRIGRWLVIFAFFALLGCAGFLTSDDSNAQPPKREFPPFYEKDGIQVWEDSARFPFEKADFFEEVKYVNGATSGELEDRAIQNAKSVGAHGIFIYKRKQSLSERNLDVGTKRGDLEYGGFDLESHGVGPEKLHFGKELETQRQSFIIYVKFFRFRKTAGQPR